MKQSDKNNNYTNISNQKNKNCLYKKQKFTMNKDWYISKFNDFKKLFKEIFRFANFDLYIKRKKILSEKTKKEKKKWL